MTQPTRIAIGAAIHVGTMLGSAFVLFAAIETVNWACIWWDARKQ